MIDHQQLRELIIRPTLQILHLDSPEAEELLVFTCAVESKGGTYLKQINGVALGIYQMEPRTYNDIWQNSIRGRHQLLNILGSNFGIFQMPNEDRMIYDLQYATIMCRLHYDRVRERLPEANDVNAIWEYYKRYYNTIMGKAEQKESIEAYEDYITQ